MTKLSKLRTTHAPAAINNHNPNSVEFVGVVDAEVGGKVRISSDDTTDERTAALVAETLPAATRSAVKWPFDM